MTFSSTFAARAESFEAGLLARYLDDLDAQEADYDDDEAPVEDEPEAPALDADPYDGEQPAWDTEDEEALWAVRLAA